MYIGLEEKYGSRTPRTELLWQEFLTHWTLVSTDESSVFNLMLPTHFRDRHTEDVGHKRMLDVRGCQDVNV